MSDRDDHTDLRLAVMRLARRIRSMQADDAVTDSQRSVLFALEGTGPITLGALSERERVTPPSMNRTVGALVEAGLVTKAAAADDARKVILQLSSTGREFVAETRRRRDAWFSTRLDALEPDELRALERAASVLGKLADS
jgi:DNA-binding MarR family transcriptional regulator